MHKTSEKSADITSTAHSSQRCDWSTLPFAGRDSSLVQRLWRWKFYFSYWTWAHKLKDGKCVFYAGKKKKKQKYLQSILMTALCLPICNTADCSGGRCSRCCAFSSSMLCALKWRNKTRDPETSKICFAAEQHLHTWEHLRRKQRYFYLTTTECNSEFLETTCSGENTCLLTL